MAKRLLPFVITALLIVGLVGTTTVDRPPRRVAVHMSAPESEAGTDVPIDASTTTTLDATTTTLAASPTTAKRTTTSPAPRRSTAVESGNITRHLPVTGPAGIYVGSTDGGDLRRLAAGDDLSGIAWSADGSQLAYVADGQLWAVNASGGPSRPLTPQSLFMVQPAWSPSGNYIAYFATDDWAQLTELRVLNLHTGAIGVIGKANTGYQNSVSWRPTGEWIAWMWTDPHGAYLEVRNVETGQTSRTPSYVGSAPFIWRPDGQAIASHGMRGLGIYAFDDLTNIAAGHTTLDVETPGMGMYDPVWIGDQIYFVNPWALDAVNVDGTNHRQVVGDYTAALKYSPQRPDDLFLLMAPPPYNVGTRRIERAGLDGSGRRVVAQPLGGQQLTGFELSPRGDLLSLTMTRTPPN